MGEHSIEIGESEFRAESRGGSLGRLLVSRTDRFQFIARKRCERRYVRVGAPAAPADGNSRAHNSNSNVIGHDVFRLRF